MLEVPNACEHHRHVVLVRGVDDLLIFDGPSRLDHGADASLGSHIDAIPKRKKRVGGKDTALDGLIGPSRCQFVRSLRDSFVQHRYPRFDLDVHRQLHST